MQINAAQRLLAGQVFIFPKELDLALEGDPEGLERVAQGMRKMSMLLETTAQQIESVLKRNPKPRDLQQTAYLVKRFAPAFKAIENGL